MKKYIVIGGEVRSATDGDWHYINAYRLCELYKINPQECYLVESNKPGNSFGIPTNLPILRPRYDGHYKIQ